MRRRIPAGFISLALLLFGGTGCGSFVAQRLAQAPNTFPGWTSPKAPVVLDMSAGFLTNFPRQGIEVGPPAARLSYRVVEPWNYRVEATATNWLEGSQTRFLFRFRAQIPAHSTATARAPRGTVVLLHGYGLTQAVMAPWALRLAQEGWRCLLVDLRGHGASTGNRIYFGTHEAWDLSQMLDALQRQGPVAEPVLAFGHSYGAALALHWQAIDPRVHASIAIAPYAELASAILNIRNQYAAWIPKTLVRAGLKKLPRVLGANPEDLNPASWLKRNSCFVLFVAGEDDTIAPAGDVARLHEMALPDSQLVVVPRARHEPLLFQFSDLVPPIVQWLNQQPHPSPQNNSSPP